ncbi:MAG: hypothetical protein Q9209_003924 [Squamulea sp. 1 TL-2023]
MTRLLFLAACFAGALATYDYGGGQKNAGGDMSGQYMNKGADQKNAMETNPGNQMSGDKSGEYMKNGGADQKNAPDMKSGSDSAVVDNSVLAISKCKGGNAPVEQIAQPAMAKGTTHKVTVGGDAGLVFTPPIIAATPGDMVEFTFMSMNHTVTQSTFPEPCKKMKDGVDSGFLPNPNNAISPPPTYIFQVKDQKPVWFYCKQKQPASHCGKGMTFSINPTAEKSHEKFTAMAMQQNGTAPAPSGGMDMNLMMSSSSSSSMSMPADTNTVPPPPGTTTTMSPPETTPTTPLEAATPATTSAPPPPPYMPPTPEQQPPASPPAAAAEMPPATPSQEPSNLNAAAGGMANNMVAGSGNMENGQLGMYGGWGGSVGM